MEEATPFLRPNYNGLLSLNETEPCTQRSASSERRPIEWKVQPVPEDGFYEDGHSFQHHKARSAVDRSHSFTNGEGNPFASIVPGTGKVAIQTELEHVLLSRETSPSTDDIPSQVKDRRPDGGHYSTEMLSIFVGPSKTLFELPILMICNLSPVIARKVAKASKQYISNEAEEWEMLAAKESCSIQEEVDGIIETSEINEAYSEPGLSESDSTQSCCHDTSPADDQFELVDPREVLHMAQSIALPETHVHAFDHLSFYVMTGSLRLFKLASSRICKCGKIELAMLMRLEGLPNCKLHDPTSHMRLIQLAEDLRIHELRTATISALFDLCGFDEFVAGNGSVPRFPHSITLTRVLPARANNSIQRFRLVVSEGANEEESDRLTAADYRLQCLVEGDVDGNQLLDVGRTSMIGPFQVRFEFWCKDLPYLHRMYSVASIRRKAEGWLSAGQEWLRG